VSAVRNSGKLLHNMQTDIDEAIDSLNEAYRLANPDPRTAEYIIRDAQRLMERMKNRLPTLRQYLDIADERSKQQQQNEDRQRLEALEAEMQDLRTRLGTLEDRRMLLLKNDRERDAG
jgi:cob(I)alamin adenosyltransferase